MNPATHAQPGDVATVAQEFGVFVLIGRIEREEHVRRAVSASRVGGIGGLLSSPAILCYAKAEPEGIVTLQRNVVLHNAAW